MLMTILFSIFGYLIAVRTQSLYSDKRFSLNTSLTKIMTLFLTLFPLACFAFHLPFVLTIGFYAAFFSASWALLLMLMRFREQKFKNDIAWAISAIIVKIRSGKGFRDSLMEVATEGSTDFNFYFGEIRDVVLFSQQVSISSDHLIGNLICEFKKIDSAPHIALRRLNTLRYEIELESDFRRRSGQVTLQARAQSNIMLGLYLAVLLFVAFEFGFSAHLKLIGLSAVSFFTGYILVNTKSGKIKWTI